MENKPAIHVSPMHGLIDKLTTITVIGCTPDETLEVELSLTDQKENEFKSTVSIKTNENGEQTLPELDVEGLFWSAEKFGSVLLFQA